MAELTLWLGNMPENPLDAAMYFHTKCIPDIRMEFETLLVISHYTIVFEPDGHEHRSWRLAAIQELAREFAPGRVNAVVSKSESAIAAAQAFLERAEGITGQLLELDDSGAGEVVSLPR
jgi:hypothetical protein